jgi:hypothetical protein
MVLKGFKVSLDSQSEVRKGIGAKSLKDLKEKVVSKFELSSKDKIFIFLPGTNEIKLLCRHWRSPVFCWQAFSAQPDICGG